MTTVLPRALSGLAVLALLLAGCGSAEEPPPPPEPAERSEPEPAPEPEPEPEPDPETYPAPLTGLPTPEEGLEQRPVLAVKIDNASAARPQAGLDEADVVFEERIEGGAVRFIALFHSVLPEVVGPVRSARPVDVEVLSGFPRPVLAYSGARAEVRELLADAPITRLTEGAPGFFRDSQRRAPHNLYVRPAEVLSTGQAQGAQGVGPGPWRHDEQWPETMLVCPDDAPADCIDPGRSTTVAMSPETRSTFVWDEDAEVYRRTQNGQPTEVSGPGRVGIANVVVLATHHYRSGCCDTAGQPYDDTELVGGDRAVVLRNGQAHRARWEKDDASSPLRLLTPEGEDFPLAPGRTWVLLPPEQAVPD